MQPCSTPPRSCRSAWSKSTRMTSISRPTGLSSRLCTICSTTVSQSTPSLWRTTLSRRAIWSAWVAVPTLSSLAATRLPLPAGRATSRFCAETRPSALSFRLPPRSLPLPTVRLRTPSRSSTTPRSSCWTLPTAVSAPATRPSSRSWRRSTPSLRNRQTASPTPLASRRDSRALTASFWDFVPARWSSSVLDLVSARRPSR